MYCKEKGRSRGADCPEDAEGDGVGVCLGFSPSHNRWYPVGGKLDVLAQIEGVHGLDEADDPHLKQVVHALAPSREALHHAEHQPEVALDQLLPRGGVARSGPLQQRPGLPTFQHRQAGGVHAADLDLSLHQKAPPPKTRVDLVFPAAGNLIRAERRGFFRKKVKKALDRRESFAYIMGALRRQQVGLPVNPAEDINKLLIVFVPLRLLMQGISF